jgi:hypothetical protein
MFHGYQDIEIWRKIAPSGLTNWEEEIWTYHHTEVDVTVQPFSSNQRICNNQLFANVVGVIITEIEADLREGDELVYLKDNTYGRVQVAELWDSDIMPHREVYVTYSQWDRNNV